MSICAHKGCERLDTEEVSLGLQNSDGEVSDESTYVLCPEHRGLLIHWIVSMGKPPFDVGGA